MRWLSMSSTRRATTSEIAQAGGVGGHEDGAVLEAGDGREEPGDLVGAEDDGELLRLLGAGDAVQDPLPAEGDLGRGTGGAATVWL